MYQSCVNAALVNCDAISVEVMDELGTRSFDKKKNVRRAALDGLADVFRKHCSDYWKQGDRN
jgi:post-segregation antitoxin (ccd killing protein)